MGRKPLGEQPLTNAEKQRRYKKKQREARKKRTEIWTNSPGFFAESSESGGWATMSFAEMKRALAALLGDYAEWEKKVVYAELYAYAQRAAGKYERAFAEVRAIEKARKGREMKHEGD